MRLQSAIFDMDGTLLDSMHMWGTLAADLIRAHGMEPEAALKDKLMVLTMGQAAQYCRDAYFPDLTAQQVNSMMKERVRDFYANEVQPKPGVQKFLSLLKMEGVWMYIATNTDRELAELALKRTGLFSYFRGILTSPEVGVGKNESPEIFERAMRRLRGNKKDTVVFEDSLHAIETAKAAGFRVCAVYDDAAEADQPAIQSLSDYYIRSFEEMFESETLS